MEWMNDLATPTPAAVADAGAERYWFPILLLVLANGALLSIGDDEWPLAIGAGVLTAAGISAFRHHRVLVAVAAAIVTMAVAVAVGEDLTMLPLVGSTCFYLAYHEPLRVAVSVGSTIAVALAIAVPLLDRERLDPLTVVGVLAVVLVPLPLLFGIVLQQQRNQLKAQIAAATASQSEQVPLAIARDLHDIVAHGLTAVAIQSGTALHLFDSKPERAKEALVNVNEASRASLTELRAELPRLHRLIGP